MSPLALTSIGPVVKLGAWGIALEIEKTPPGVMGARQRAYAIASLAFANPDFSRFDMRVLENTPGVSVAFEVSEPEHFDQVRAWFLEVVGAAETPARSTAGVRDDLARWLAHGLVISDSPEASDTEWDALVAIVREHGPEALIGWLADSADTIQGLDGDALVLGVGEKIAITELRDLLAETQVQIGRLVERAVVR